MFTDRFRPEPMEQRQMQWLEEREDDILTLDA